MQKIQNLLQLIGGPTVLIEYDGLRFLTDPTFDKSGFEYDMGHLVLKKSQAPAISENEVGQLDAILLSHDQHPDNLDISGKQLLTVVKKTYSTPIAAERLGGNVQGLQVWEEVLMTGADGHRIKITATPCRHGPAGFEAIAGEVTGFMLESDALDAKTLYITGDTVYYKGIEEVAERFSPDIIVAFAGAARPRGPLHLTMSANDLIDTSALFSDAVIIPVHAEGWEHYSQTTQEIEMAFSTLKITERLNILKVGETHAF